MLVGAVALGGPTGQGVPTDSPVVSILGCCAAVSGVADDQL